MRDRLLARAHAGVSEVTHLEITPWELLEFEAEVLTQERAAVRERIRTGITRITEIGGFPGIQWYHANYASAIVNVQEVVEG